MSNLWFPFAGNHETTLSSRRWWWDGGLCMASYKYENSRIQVWADEVCDPNVAVMFLFRNLQAGTRSPVPNYIITDGQKWCPLVFGDHKKFYSYPTGYSGLKFSLQDQEVLVARIKRYVEWLEEQS